MEINKDYKLAKNDLMKFSWFYSKKKLIIMSLVYLLLGAFFGFALHMMSYGAYNHSAIWKMCVSAVIFVAFIYAIFIPVTYFRISKNYSTNPLYQETYHFKFTNKDLTIEIGENKSVLSWDKFFTKKESKSYIYFYTSNSTAYILPKSLFTETELQFIQKKFERSKKC